MSKKPKWKSCQTLKQIENQNSYPSVMGFNDEGGEWASNDFNDYLIDKVCSQCNSTKCKYSPRKDDDYE